VQAVGFDHVGVFTYSHEEGTSAHGLTDDVPAAVKRSRQRKLMRQQQKIVAQAQKRRVGDTIRVMVDGYDTASVSIGDFDSEADEDASAREREETKRLLYVALTRARDRLYLGAVVKEGVFKPGRGSLGEVLPPGVRLKFVS